MSLHHLPDELLLHIASYLDYLSDMNSLAKTNLRIYHALNLDLCQISIQRNSKFFDLPTCAWHGLTHHVRILLDMGVEPSDKDRALYMAAVGEEHSITKLLIESGANVNARMPNGFTPLHAAVTVGPRNGNVIGTRILIENGAGIEEITWGHKRYYGYNALHIAHAFGKIDVAELLLDSGMDIEGTAVASLDFNLHCTYAFGEVLCNPFRPNNFSRKDINWICYTLYTGLIQAQSSKRRAEIHDEPTTLTPSPSSDSTVPPPNILSRPTPAKKWTRKVPRAVMRKVTRAKSIILHVAWRKT